MNAEEITRTFWEAFFEGAFLTATIALIVVPAFGIGRCPALTIAVMWILNTPFAFGSWAAFRKIYAYRHPKTERKETDYDEYC